MSITDEGTKPPNEPASSEKPENASSGNNGEGHPAQGLPGLAGFGQVQGYAPVTEPPQQAEAPYEPVAEPEIPADLPADHYDHDYSQDYSHEPQVYAEHIEPDAGIDDTDAGSTFVSDDVHSYMEEQNVSHDEDLNSAPASGIETDAELHPDTAYHGEAGNSLQTFEAHYDQHPEIPLGAFEGPGEPVGEPVGDQPFFHEPEQTGDAEFMGGESAPEVAAPKERRVRKILMASSGLIGVLALGGALAFAYKIGGDSDIASTGKPPLIQADSRPVKVAPDKPGGKQFPHKNKKIYERLQGEKSQEVERLVPRQEDVAAAATAALATSQSSTGAQAQKLPAPGEKTSPAGTPRKVKTLTVRPDGTLEAASPRQKVVKAPPAQAAPQGSVPDGTVSMSFPQPLSSKPTVTASAPAPVSAPVPAPVPASAAAVKAVTPGAPAPVAATPPPVQKPLVPSAVTPAPAPQQIASAPAFAPAVSGGKYVVQVASRKSQTDALAAFADIQQKYPRLLSGYRPIIKRADLGSKGVWYRLNVGPVESKKVASSLCGSLKGAGMRSCIVRSQ
jgi:hypothetical protein